MATKGLGALRGQILASLTGLVALLLAGCGGGLLFEEEPNEDQRLACGLQCLKNGESCSQFFARVNENHRLDYEKAKENYWICLRKYPATAGREGPCVAPSVKTQQFDQCGPDLDACFESCGTNLQELEEFQRVIAAKQPAAAHAPVEPPRFEAVPVPSNHNFNTMP